jgi:hypothetical protein
MTEKLPKEKVSNEDKSKSAFKRFSALVESLEKIVKVRIRNSLPMGDLPDNPNTFLNNWTEQCEVKISRSTYYKDQEDHEDLRKRAARQFGKVKNPPIPKGEREILNQEIEDQNEEIKVLREANLKLTRKVRDIDSDYLGIIQEKDQEIRALKKRMGILRKAGKK